MEGSRMRRFWDRRADEDPWFFVDDRLDYGAPDLERFWAGGEADLDALRTAVQAPDFKPSERIVDVGCGVGRLTRVLAARGAHVDAIDVSPRMIALAREHNSHLDDVRWLLGDGESLRPIEDSSADWVVSHVVFQHIPDPLISLGYVREIGRVLKPGGRTLFQISTDPSVHRRRTGASALGRRLLAGVGRAPRGQADAEWLGSAVEIGALERAAVDGGLEIERIAYAGTQYTVVLARRT